MMAKIFNDGTDGEHFYGYTLKQAYKALYDECKQKAMHWAST
jgi:hypothetical protein